MRIARSDAPVLLASRTSRHNWCIVSEENYPHSLRSGPYSFDLPKSQRSINSSHERAESTDASDCYEFVLDRIYLHSMRTLICMTVRKQDTVNIDVAKSFNKEARHLHVYNILGSNGKMCTNKW